MSGAGTGTRERVAPPAGDRYVGARMARVEDPRFLVGEARYIDNERLPGALHAAFVRSPMPHARIRSVDLDAARAAAGVIGAFAAADLAEEFGPMVTDPKIEGVAKITRHPLAADRVRHVGEPVAVVVAESRYLAEDACDLVAVEYEPLTPVADVEFAVSDAAPLLHEDAGSNRIAVMEDSAGDVEAAFAAADHVFRKRFQHGRSAAAPLEGRAVMAEFDAATGELRLWCASQLPHVLRTYLAPILGISERLLRVISPDVGGGFGLKLHPFPEDVVIPALARLLRRPIKWIEDRYENLAAGVHSKEMTCEIELATSADGEFLAMRASFISDGGAYGAGLTNALVDTINAATGLPSLYKMTNVAYRAEVVLTNKAPIGAVRGVGWSPGQTLRETLIEDVARELGLDPVQLRLKNCIPSEPQVNPFGARYDGGSYSEALEQVSERIGYAELRGRQAQLRAEGRYVGVGFSAFIEPGGLGCAGSAVNRLPATYYDLANVTVEADGTATVRTGLHSHGQGHETTLAQVAADELGLTPELIRMVYGDTDSSVYGSGTHASRSAVIGSGSIVLAARVVAERLREIAAMRFQVPQHEIELGGGYAWPAADPGNRLEIAELAAFAYFGGPERPLEIQENGLTATRSYDPLETYGNGAIAAAVEVDAGTGFVSILEIALVEDCGVMLNPMIVDGQVSGAVAQGIGVALLEEAAYDGDAQFLAGSLMDYLYPSSAEVPMLDIGHIETPSPVSLNGVKGMGESGVIATPAAIVNAIADALSPFAVEIDHVPVTPSELLAKIDRGRVAPA